MQHRSPPAYRSLAQSVRGLAGAKAIADESEDGLDATGLVQRIVVAISSPNAYKMVAAALFGKFSTTDRSGTATLPSASVIKVLRHWQIPEEYESIFWAMIWRQESHWDQDVDQVPETINLEDFEDALLKLLRRVRDKFCVNKAVASEHVTEKRGVLSTKYESLDACNSGGLGECLAVSQRETGQRRICKRISKNLVAAPPEEVQADLEALAGVGSHPNIASMYEWFETPDQLIIILDNAPCHDLQRVLERCRGETHSQGLQEPIVQSVARQVIAGLKFLHSKHIMHRDVRPRNMLITAGKDSAEMHLMLVDHGMAWLIQTEGEMRLMANGPVAYMAPEVFRNFATPRSDLWALGIVIYELFAEQRPFKGDSPLKVYTAVASSTLNVSPVREAGASHLATLFLTELLEKKVSRRPSAVEASQAPWFRTYLQVDTSAYGSAFLGSPMHHGSSKSVSFMSTGEEASRVGTPTSIFPPTAVASLAAQLDTETVEKLGQAMKDMDSDNDGLLTMSELAACLAEAGASSDVIVRFSESMDANSVDEMVDHADFIASVEDCQARLVDDVVLQTFRLFDFNQDGVISIEELRAMMGADGPLASIVPAGKTAEEVLKEVDLSQDGTIDLEEFKAYLDGGGSDGIEEAGDEPLSEVLERLAPVIGRSVSECVDQATQLSQRHWMRTVRDLQGLRDDEWLRLQLPLKLERALRAYVGDSHP